MTPTALAINLTHTHTPEYMQTEQLIGQLFLTGFYGESVTAKSPVIHDIQERNLGGVIFFDRFLAGKKQFNNIISHNQVKELTSRLQDTAGGQLLIAVDQEGGQVNRFRKESGFPQTPPAQELGESTDTTRTRNASSATARLLLDIGCNFNLAPVVDINSFPDNPIIGRYKRSFSDLHDMVTKHAAAWIEEHHQRGIHCCLKHFPGHGSSRADSHLGFVDITDSWQSSELTPYRSLLKEGLVDSVMTGHLYNRSIDFEYPATLSASTISILKKDLGFNGPLLSDDMQMGAITSRYGLEQAVCLAIQAGVDMVVVGNNLAYDQNILSKLVKAVLNSIKRGDISEQRLYDAYHRVQKLKQPLQQ
ncbi:glycoside hydrolase family 3 protein [Desulfopila sp. IMCC35008]|uniref:glycoside hydrolase family 3 protein n=1 Tax=Desulfopila sp. IMCC35008 TaxID=2653858 RepID=UPI0013D537BE|nr:glycoside hydrolase family 3 protein [Desulfopila sp. IMCC35008]